MMTSFIEINGCKHYVVNEQGQQRMFFIHSPFMVEEDYDLQHPIGRVYKPKGCIDSQVRFVRQQNNSVLLFRKKEWNKIGNPFYIRKQVHFKGIFQKLWEMLEYKIV